jgi:hypothetical protein
MAPEIQKKRTRPAARLGFLWILYRSSELVEEAQVVLEEQADVGNSVFSRSEAFDAESEGPAGAWTGKLCYNWGYLVWRGVSKRVES